MPFADQPYPAMPIGCDGTCDTCGCVLPAGVYATGLSDLLFCPPHPGISGTWGQCVEAYIAHRSDKETRRIFVMLRYATAVHCEEVAADFDAARAGWVGHPDEVADLDRIAGLARAAGGLKRGKTIAAPPAGGEETGR